MVELSHSQSEDDIWSQVIKNLKWKRLIIDPFFLQGKKKKKKKIIDIQHLHFLGCSEGRFQGMLPVSFKFKITVLELLKFISSCPKSLFNTGKSLST